MGFEALMVRLSLPLKHYSSRFSNRVYYSIAANSQIAKLASLGQIKDARKVFDEVPNKTIGSWNSIVSCYFENHLSKDADELFQKMPKRDKNSWYGLITGYLKNGMVDEPREAFERMPARRKNHVVSWNAMLEKISDAWTEKLFDLHGKGLFEEVCELYPLIPVKNDRAKYYTVSGYCKMPMDFLSEAREIFEDMDEPDVDLYNWMICRYSLEGLMSEAREVFDVMPKKDKESRILMLSGYIMCGRNKEAYAFFDAMSEKSVTDYIELICGYGLIGKVEKVRKVFDGMVKKDWNTYNAMINTYHNEGFELKVRMNGVFNNKKKKKSMAKHRK